jgi:cyclase
LDIKGGDLVKGVRLEGLRVLGKPELFARHYYETGADELIYMDVVASLYERNNILDVVKATSSEVFIPLTVGGGMRTLEDVRNALRNGADKVAINTAAIRDPGLIEKAAKEFGSSTIVLSIESKKRHDGTYEAYTDCGRERTGLEVLAWAERGVRLGAGEILLTSIDRDGTGLGYDLELTRRLSERMPVPVIICGGAGRIDDLSTAARETSAEGISLASALHYRALETDPSLAGGCSRVFRGGFSMIQGATIPLVKEHLQAKGIACRPAPSACHEPKHPNGPKSDKDLEH